MLLDPVQVLVGPGQAVEKQSAVLIRNRRLEAFGDEARRIGRLEALEAQDAGQQLLARKALLGNACLPLPDRIWDGSPSLQYLSRGESRLDEDA